MATEDAVLLAGMADYSSAEQPSVQLSDVMSSGADSLGEFIEGGRGYFFGGADVVGEPGISADLRDSVLADIGKDPIGSARKASDWADEQLLSAFRGDAEAARNSADMASFIDHSGVSDALSAISSARLAYERPSEQLGGHLFDVGISSLAAAVPLVGSGFAKRIIKGAPEVADVARAERVIDDSGFSLAADKSKAIFRLDASKSDGAVRDIVVVTMPDGSSKAFYRSTGTSAPDSGSKGLWAPFEGFATSDRQPVGATWETHKTATRLAKTHWNDPRKTATAPAGSVHDNAAKWIDKYIEAKGGDEAVFKDTRVLTTGTNPDALKMTTAQERKDLGRVNKFLNELGAIDFNNPYFRVNEYGQRRQLFGFPQTKEAYDYSPSVAKAAPTEPAPVFESVLERVVSDKMPNKVGVNDVEKFLMGKGAKRDELTDTKVYDFIETAKASGKKSISKDELIKHLEDNKVQIEEVRLSDNVPIPQEVRDLGVKRLEASRALRSEVESLSGVLAPGENLGTHRHKFEQDPTHFRSLYNRYTDDLGDIDRYGETTMLPADVHGVVSRLIKMVDDVKRPDWTPKDAALITEARTTVNAAVASAPKYVFQFDSPDYRNLKKIADILNKMPEAESRLAALRKFENLPKYQEYSSLHRQHKTKVETADKSQRTRWKEYTVPGGEDYQEILLTVPSAGSKEDQIRALQTQIRDGRMHGEIDDIDFVLDPNAPEVIAERERVSRLRRKIDRAQEPFTGSHHSDIPNVMAHIRFKTRIDSKGRRIMFIEEIQSDWHQKGLKRGYRKEFRPLNKDDIEIKRVSPEEFVQIQGGDAKHTLEKMILPYRKERGIDPSEPITLYRVKGERGFSEHWDPRVSDQQTLEEINNQRRVSNRGQNRDTVPNAPLKDTKEWAGLAVKRIFREAADQGFDGVAFTRADMITPIVTLGTGDDAFEYIANTGAYLARLAELKKKGGQYAESAEEAEKVFKGNQYFYDKLIPSIVKKEMKAKQSTTAFEMTDEFGHGTYKGAIEVPFFELTKEVKDKVIQPQKLYSLALPGIAIGAAAAGEEELSAAAALGAIGMGGMALYRGAKGARGAARAADLKVPTETAAYEGQQKVGKVLFDSKDGMGAVPNNRNVAYKGFVAWMKPRDFLGLNPERAAKHAADTVKAVTKAIDEGKPIGPPFLSVKLVKEGENAGSFQVFNHEGRGRMAAINDIDPDTPVPVHIFGSGGIDRGRDITPKMMEDLVDPGSKVRLLPDKKVAEGKEVTPDAAWHVPDSDDYDPNYLPVGKTYRATDVAKPPAAAMKLPETQPDIDAAFRALGDAQKDRPETAMLNMQRAHIAPLWSGTAEHVGDIIHRMTPSGPSQKYVPPVFDVIPKIRRGIFDLSGDIEGGIRSQAGTEAKLNELRALGQKYADEHRKLPVYNELQMLANDAAIALGEGRFADSKAALVKLDQINTENPRKFWDRLEVVEPEFARPGSAAAKPPAAASKLDDETGNPFGDDYEPLKADVTDYVADFQELSDEDFSLDELDRQSDMIVAEYSSLSDEEKLGRRGGILVEWYDEVSDQISAASQAESAGEYERFLRGPEAYLPAGGSGTDDLRGFVQVGLAPRVDRSLIERGLVEDAQRARLAESLEQGSPMVDLYGRFGKLNRYLFSKARHYGEPVGTVQLSTGDKLVLSGDRENLDRLSRSGLITDLLYRELLGSVKLLPFGG